MLVISQRPRHPCWRMLLVVAILSSLVRHCEPMSTRRLTDSSPLSSPTLSRNSAESRSQNLGSPSDLAWQAWLLVDSQTGAQSSMDSATFLRRITPKSVFIAPALPALPPCADGYRADTMGRCVKNVNIDHEAHLGFLLKQLNHRYGNQGSPEASASNNNQKKSSGPLQLNIPLLSDMDISSSKEDYEETRDTIKIPVIIPPRGDDSLKEDDQELETTDMIYQTSDDSNEDENDSSFLYNNTSTVSSDRDDQSATLRFLLGNASTVSSDRDDQSTTLRFLLSNASTASSNKDDQSTTLRFLVSNTSTASTDKDDQSTTLRFLLSNTSTASTDKDDQSTTLRFLLSNISTVSYEKDDQSTTPRFVYNNTSTGSSERDDQTTTPKFQQSNGSTVSSDKDDQDTTTRFLRNNSSTVSSDKDDQSTTPSFDDVPVAEFIYDTNDTNSFSDVVDYKIPIDLRAPLNVSSVTTLNNATDDQDLLWSE